MPKHASFCWLLAAATMLSSCFSPAANTSSGAPVCRPRTSFWYGITPDSLYAQGAVIDEGSLVQSATSIAYTTGSLSVTRGANAGPWDGQSCEAQAVLEVTDLLAKDLPTLLPSRYSAVMAATYHGFREPDSVWLDVEGERVTVVAGGIPDVFEASGPLPAESLGVVLMISSLRKALIQGYPLVALRMKGNNHLHFLAGNTHGNLAYELAMCIGPHRRPSC